MNVRQIEMLPFPEANSIRLEVCGIVIWVDIHRPNCMKVEVTDSSGGYKTGTVTYTDKL